MSLRMEKRQSGDVVIFDCQGRITLGEGANTLRDRMRDEVRLSKEEGRSTKILLNLSEVSYMDSSGRGELVSAFTLVSNNGGSVKLLGLGQKMTDLLMITKLYTVFESFEDEQEAVRSFGPSRDTSQSFNPKPDSSFTQG